jgi:hypothetical protein
MRVDPKKFSALKTEAGLDDIRLSRLMGYSDPAGLRYQLAKVRAGASIKEGIVRLMLDAFGAKLRRRVGIRELVYATDLPRETGRVRKAKA